MSGLHMQKRKPKYSCTLFLHFFLLMLGHMFYSHFELNIFVKYTYVYYNQYTLFLRCMDFVKKLIFIQNIYSAHNLHKLQFLYCLTLCTFWGAVLTWCWVGAEWLRFNANSYLEFSYQVSSSRTHFSYIFRTFYKKKC